jgi:hypothetical protein
MADFLETLYHENREAVHFFADEIHTIAPLTLGKVGNDAAVYQARCVGAIEDIILQGRRRGIGMTGMSQRPALVNANVRSQFGTLIAMQIVAPLDRKAIAEWIAEKGTEEEGEKMLAQLPRLERGTGIVWSPTFDILKTVKFRERRTFDSGRTPGVGEKRVEPKAWATIDPAKLGEKIRAVREERKANDPAALKRRIAELEKLGTAKPVTETRVIEKPVVTDKQVKAVEDIVTRLEKEGERRIAAANVLRESGEQLKTTARDFAAALRTASSPAPLAHRPPVQPRHVTTRPLPSRVTSQTGDTSALPKGERAVLTAVAMYPDGIERDQLSVLTGYKRSSRDTYLQRLSERGCVQSAGSRIVATPDGMSALGDDFVPLPTGDELREYWTGRLPEGERRVFEVVTAAYPNAVPREQIDESTGYKRSSRDTYLQRLSSRRLVESIGRGEVKASDNLFD